MTRWGTAGRSHPRKGCFHDAVLEQSTVKHRKLYILLAIGVAAAAAFFYFVFGPYWQMEENEAAAIKALRILSSAEELYRTHTGPYGDYYQLYHWRYGKYIPAELAAADPDHPQHRPLDGYTIDISLHPQGYDWCATARPVKWGITGARNFKIQSDGVIRYNGTENGTEFTEPALWKGK